MSYVPEFENDVFISYAHIDNLPLTEGQKGWIDHFHRTLEVRLQQLLGENLEIWRDPKLQGNDYFSDTLLDKLSRIGILISIVSPRYLKSEWCLKELKEFINAVEQSGGIRVQNKSRIIKVVKTYVPREEHPQELQSFLGYEFYQVDPSTGRTRDFLPDPQFESYKKYWEKLDDVAQDVHELLKTVRSVKTGSPLDKPSSGATIYLAETTSDLISERERIKRELIQRGHTILPDRPLPLDASELKEQVTADVRRSTLSIHLIGQNYGIIPEGESRSIVCLQNEIAANVSEDSLHTRVVWLPVELKAKEKRQEEFISYLQSESSGLPGVEFLQTTLEDLKTFVLDRLSRSSEKPKGPNLEQGPARIYLIHDKGDIDSVYPLDNYLYNKGYEVKCSIFEGDPNQLLEYHIQNLVLCDAAIIYYGTANELWLQIKLGDLAKALGYGRSKPISAKAVYVSAPVTKEKERFHTREAFVIRNFEAFSPEVLNPFLDQFEDAK